MEGFVVAGLVLIAVAVIAAVLWRRSSANPPPASLPVAIRPLSELRDDFRIHRELLEAKFFEAAAARGIPRGLAWARCDFADQVTFARDKQNAEPCALVAVTIGFEAIEGGGMEEVEAVGNLRAATAVFRHRVGRWLADGRVVFNLNPEQTIAHFGHELEAV
jgi:hypothetical protein